jgi:nitrogen-specific signal transduction histidine kinase
LEQKLPLYPLNNSDRRPGTEDSIATDPFSEQENGKNSLISLLMGGAKTTESKEKPPPDEQNIPSWLILFADLSRGIKDSLEKIKSFVHLSREKFGDAEYGEYFYKTISEDISKTEAVLNCFTNYLKINSPLPKTNTVHLILEEALKYYENALEDKKIKIRKQYEEDLPETSLRDEQLRFIINSILQYAIPSIPPHGSIGFLTRSNESQKVMDGGKSPLQKNEKYIEVLAGFTGYQNGSQPLEDILANPVSSEKEKDDFVLHLVEEIIKMNRGMMEIKVDDDKLITMISLILPMEERRTVHYQSTTA